MALSGSRKTVFITGAASGIGRATAQLFASRGWFVGLYDIDEAKLRETQALIAADRQTSGLLDVRDRGAWANAVAQFGDQTGGKLHVLFNNAGIGRGGWFEEVDPADSDLVIDVNFRGIVNGVYAALPLLKATPGARIVNTASMAAAYGTPRAAIYSATKFAVRGLTEALDIEFKRHGVRVTSLMPWFIDTPLLDGAVAGGSNEPIRQSLGATKVYPVQRAAERAWDAAHGAATHYTVGEEAARVNLLARLFPGLVKSEMAKMAAPAPRP
jgi:NAD(P)-dependent dehydrogenase (short-subunit alcohol dehydrogenase family)